MALRCLNIAIQQPCMETQILRYDSAKTANMIPVDFPGKNGIIMRNKFNSFRCCVIIPGQNPL